MPVSYSPDIRIRELEKLFQNTQHYPEGTIFNDYNGLWTKKDLAEKISSVFDLKKIISEKTIENDLRKMEEDYNAPIEKRNVRVKVFTEDGEEKFVTKIAYYYYDTSISIFNNNNLGVKDLKNLRTVIGMLEQFKGFKHFEDISLLIDKLEIKSFKNTKPDIFFDTVDSYTGIEHIDSIAKAVKEKKTLKIKYKPFDSKSAVELTIHPYQLREFNNRWFVLASTDEYKERNLGIYGLGRILEEPQKLNIKFLNVKPELINNYFKDIIGVTNFIDKQVENIKFEIFGNRAFYVKTKPWHPSQQIVANNKDSKIFTLRVKINNELIALILSYSNDIKILSPDNLKEIIQEKLKQAMVLYDSSTF